MLQFTVGALLLLLPWFGDLVTGELSDDFSQCKEYFYNGNPPKTIPITDNYQPICQRYKNKYRFATLYHRQHRAPLYSAYKITSSKGKRPDDPWMYEPQLATRTAGSEMQLFPAVVDQNVIESQAVLADYQASIYTKGHLAPSLHLDSVEDREATYTLTNIVPQREMSNTGPWEQLETEVAKRFQQYCTGNMFVLTGGIPFQENRLINNRVSIPEYMWSAYKCPTFKPDLPEKVKHLFPTYAAVGRNDPNSGDDIVPKDPKLKPQFQDYTVRQMPLKELEKILRKKLSLEISLF